MKILLIAHNYLFESSASGLIERTFFEHLQNNNVYTTVVCSDHKPMRADFLKTTIHKAKDNQFVRYIIAFLKRAVATDFAFLPDYRWYSWGRNAIKLSLNICKKDRFDIIHSIGIPHASHLVANQIKKTTGLPWVAQFYDPWVGNPYREYKFKWSQRLDAKQEELVALNADLIVHNSWAAANDWIERYGDIVRKKIVVLPLVINRNELTTRARKKKSNNERITISHIGNLYPTRTSETFIAAVQEAIQSNPKFRTKLRIVYIGNVTEMEKSLVEKYNLEDIFEFKGVLSGDECLKWYNESDAFMSVDRATGKAFFFPSKIMKYFYYQKPIIGITPKNSVLDGELLASGNYSFRNNDIQGLKNFISDLINNYDEVSSRINKNYWERFQVENVATQYLECLSQISTVAINYRDILIKN